MKAPINLTLLMVAISCGCGSPKVLMPSPTPFPPEPIASTTPALVQRAPRPTPPPPEPIASATSTLEQRTPTSTPPPELMASTTATSGQPTPTRTPPPPIVFEAAGARFQIENAAIYSRCLTLSFAIRDFLPPTGLRPHAFLPPARSIAVRVTTPDGELLAEPLGEDEANQGNEQDGRIWLLQQAVFSLPREIPLNQEFVLEVTVNLDEDFQSVDPLSYRFSVVSSPGTGSCP